MNLMIQQGWQCPCCRRIYSPTTPMCFTCPQQTTVAPNTVPTTGTPLPINPYTTGNDK